MGLFFSLLCFGHEILSQLLSGQDLDLLQLLLMLLDMLVVIFDLLLVILDMLMKFIRFPFKFVIFLDDVSILGIVIG